MFGSKLKKIKLIHDIFLPQRNTESRLKFGSKTQNSTELLTSQVKNNFLKMQSTMLLVVPTQWGQSSVFVSPAIQVVLGMADQEYVPGGFCFAVI